MMEHCNCANYYLSENLMYLLPAWDQWHATSIWNTCGMVFVATKMIVTTGVAHYTPVVTNTTGARPLAWAVLATNTKIATPLISCFLVVIQPMS